MTVLSRRGATAAAPASKVSGNIAATLPALTQAATGTAVDAGVTAGNIAATLPALTQAATGSVEVRGNIAATLPALTQAATGTVAAPPAAEISDTFDRADEALEASADWVVDRQDADIVSNELVVDAVKAFHQTALSSDDHYVEFDVVDAGSASTGAYLRHDSATSESNGYHARIDGQVGGGFQIYRIDAGSFTLLGTLTSVPVVDGDHVRFEVEGSTIRCLLNGVVEMTRTDSTHTVGKYVGLREGRGQPMTIDNFEASAL